MKKVAVVGQIHQAGWEVLKNAHYEVFEIKDFSQDNLKREMDSKLHYVNDTTQQ